MRAWNAGFAVGEVPITFREREHGHSKISRTIVDRGPLAGHGLGCEGAVRGAGARSGRLTPIMDIM